MISVPLNLDYKQVSYFALPIDGGGFFFCEAIQKDATQYGYFYI